MNKGKYSKWIVTLVIILNVIFTCGVLISFLKVGKEPKTLITAWFTWTTGELWLLANIKKEKMKKEGK